MEPNSNYCSALSSAHRIHLLCLALCGVLVSCYFNNNYEPSQPFEDIVVTIPDSVDTDVLEVLVVGTKFDTVHFFTVWPSEDNTIHVPAGGERTVTVTAFNEGTRIASTTLPVPETGSTNCALTVRLELMTAVPPESPGTPEATLMRDTVHLTWISSANATFYKVLRTCDTAVLPVEFIVSGTWFTDSAIPPCSIGYYAVVACNSAGNSLHSPFRTVRFQDTLPVVQIPQTPSGVSVETNSGSVHFSWISVAGATGYRIYRTTDTTTTMLLLETVAVTEFTDLNVVSGTRYFYYFSAVNSLGESNPTSPYTVILSDSQTVPPVTPTGISATARSESSIELTWKTVQSATGYIIYRSGSPSDAYESVDTIFDIHFIDTELAPTTMYYYRITAINSAGVSPLSPITSASTTTAPLSAPPAPQGLSATTLSDATIRLTWHHVVGADRYRLYRSAGQSGNGNHNGENNGSDSLQTEISTIDSTSDTVYADMHLTAATSYFYAVDAINSAGISPRSDTVSARTADPAIAIPTVPQQLSVQSATHSSITLSWQTVTGASSYSLYRSSAIAGPFNPIQTTGLTTATDTGLRQNTTYYYTVAAVNSAGASNQSTAISAATSLFLAPPTSVTATSLSSSSISLFWTAANGATGYAIYRSTTTGGNYLQAGLTTATTFTDTGLAPGTTYTYTVTSRSGPSESDPSDAISAATGTAVPSVPQQITAVAQSTGSIIISWAPVSGADGYTVYSSTDPVSTFTRLATTGSTSYTHNGLTSSSTVYYRISASNGSGESPLSSVVSATPATPQPPETPSGLSATARSSSEIEISFTVVTGATGYIIYAAENPNGTFSPLQTVAGTSYIHTGLTSGATWYYKVAAVNSSGTSPQSTAVAATTTTAPVPETPRGLSASTVSSSEINVQFTSVSGAQYYTIYTAASANGPFTALTTLTVTSYTHGGLSPATTVWYKTSATNSIGESPQSTAVSATTSNVAPSKYAVVNASLCTGCRKYSCNAVCEFGAVSKVGEKAVIDPDKCTGCGKCVSACTNGAIQLKDR